MRAQTLVKRYAQGLVAAIKTEEEFAAVLEELKEVNRLFEVHYGLKKIFLSPLLPANKKKGVIQSVLAVLRLSPKTNRFLRLLNEHQRLNLLHEIVLYLPYAWKEKQGVVIFEVRSAVPLEKEEVEELRRGLEKMEAAPVHLDIVVDTEVVGGFRLRKGNIVYDASVKGQLQRIKEILSEA